MEFDAQEQAVREDGRYRVEAANGSGSRLLEWLQSLGARAQQTAPLQQAAAARDSADAYVRAHPYVAIAAALGAGLLIGMLLRRR